MLVTLSSLSFSLHMCLNGEVITNKPQGCIGSFIFSEKEHDTLGLDIFFVNFSLLFHLLHPASVGGGLCAVEDKIALPSLKVLRFKKNEEQLKALPNAILVLWFTFI